MGISQLIRILNTVKYLKRVQVFYRLFYFFRNKIFKKTYHILQKSEKINILNCYHFHYSTPIYNNSFSFLNKTKSFNVQIDWNFLDYGKLWTYNLNYFDFLNHPTLTTDHGLKLIKNYVDNHNKLIDGLEPYPISLRTINWIKFLSKNKIENTNINQVLKSDYKCLCNNLEYHLLGNHLLENGFALLFGAYFFKDEKLYSKAKKIIENQLKEQVLDDGAHFELSPMYHQIILFKVLDSIFLIKNNTWKEDTLLKTLIINAKKMLSFLKAITFTNGNIPMVNDSAFNIAPTTKQILNLAVILNIEVKENLRLSDSGYRKVKTSNYELFFDVGAVGPKYQPGHAHSDTFNFILYFNKKPFIVDRGTSTYQKDALRQSERSTASHNTVMVESREQTDVWGGFRVGSRAEIISLIETENKVTAAHNGYKSIGIKHQRCFNYLENEIYIIDTLFGGNKYKKQAFLHFHPDIKKVNIDNNTLSFAGLKIKIIFNENAKLITVQKYNYCKGFNRTLEAFKIVVDFNDPLTTKIIM